MTSTPLTFNITFKGNEMNTDHYDICHIDYLSHVIKYYGMWQIDYISFYFDISGNRTGIVYKVINHNDGYIFAPFYDYMMTKTIKSKYLDIIKESLFTTIKQYSKDINDTFINYINESIVISYDEHDE